MKKAFLLFVFILIAYCLILTTASFVHGTEEILTYYPAPRGVYQQLRVTWNLTIPHTTGITPLEPYGTGIIYCNDHIFIHNFGTGNFFAGINAGNLMMDGTNNVAIGTNAMMANTTGANNTAVGHIALSRNTTGADNTAVGNCMAANTIGQCNVAVGVGSLGINTIGSYNVAIGNAMTSNLTGEENVAIGYRAMSMNNNGNCNVAVGYGSLLENIAGSYNSALGRDALGRKCGDNNTAIGYAAGDIGVEGFAPGANNVFIGEQAGYNVTGDSNVFIGSRAGKQPGLVNIFNKLYIANSSGTPLIYGDFNTNKVTINDVLRLAPRNSDPSDPSEGEIYYNSIAKAIKYYDGTGWKTLSGT